MLLDALRAVVILAVALGSMLVVRRAAARRLVLATALASVVLLPALSALVPAWHVSTPELHARLVAEAIVDGPVSAPVASASFASSHASPLDVRELLLVIWALGALFVLARTAAANANARRIVRAATPMPDFTRGTGLVADVRAHSTVLAPAVTGLFRSVVLVPPGADSWSVARRTSVLRHELAHVAQRDCLVQLVAQLACAMHWPNPLAWIAARRLRLERELAADDAVLAGGARATEYAEHLVAIASGTAALDGTLGMASALEERVVAIVSPRRRSTLSRRGAGAIIAAGAIGSLAIACAKPSPAPAPSPATVDAPLATPPLSSALQKIADEELALTLKDSQGKAGVILVLDPKSGRVLASAGAADHAYITGSTLKPFVLAGALEDGIVRPDDRFDLEHGSMSYQGQTVHDASKDYGSVTVAEMLAVSSNIGFTKLFDRMGGARLDRWLHAFHFDAAPVADHSFDGAMLAIGERATTTPLQVAKAYASLANGGDGIVSPATAAAVRTMLEGVVYGEHATGRLAQVDGVRVAGKTGTASWDLPGGGEAIYASFVGFVPSEAPRYVILVGVEQPKGGASGPRVAAPAFARVATRALASR